MLIMFIYLLVSVRRRQRYGTGKCQYRSRTNRYITPLPTHSQRAGSSLSDDWYFYRYHLVTKVSLKSSCKSFISQFLYLPPARIRPSNHVSFSIRVPLPHSSLLPASDSRSPSSFLPPPPSLSSQTPSSPSPLASCPSPASSPPAPRPSPPSSAAAASRSAVDRTAI